MAEFIPLGIAAVLTILLLFLRTNVAVCFLALCAGSVLVEYSGDNIGLIASSLTSGASFAPYVARTVLLLTPFLACAVFLRDQLPKALIPVGLFPALMTALLGVLFVIPLLPESQYQAFSNTESWVVLYQYQELIVGIGVVMSVVTVILMSKKGRPKKRKGY